MSGKRSFVIDTDFPGGNIVVESIRGNTVKLHQDTRDTEGWWFYWYFRVKGASGRSIRFQFTNGAVISSRGPAYSYDGLHWSWLNKEEKEGTAFTFSFPEEKEEVYFSMGMPYLERNLNLFLERHLPSDFLRKEILCRSRHGRDVECLFAGCLQRNPKARVLVVARHHACEMMASYVMEGIMEYLFSKSQPARYLRENVEFMFVPFVDKDGVEEGDPGKNRRPHDHNRDYSGTSIYPEVKAIRNLVPEWSAGKLKVTLDLHCPMLRGKNDEKIFLVGSPYPAIWEQQRQLGKILQYFSRKSLPYCPENDIPFGVGWNSPKNFEQGKPFSDWAGQLPEVVCASSIEIAYASADGAEVNQSTARLFGQTLARTIAEYLQKTI